MKFDLCFVGLLNNYFKCDILSPVNGFAEVNIILLSDDFGLDGEGSNEETPRR